MLKSFVRTALAIVFVASALFFVGSSSVLAFSSDEILLKRTSNGEENPAKYTTASQDAGALFKGVTVACWHEGSCTLCDAMLVLINVADGILRLLAIVGVLFFVYGAGLLVLSQGNEDMISKGKSSLKATIFGTVVVLVGWQVMSLVVYFVVLNSINPSVGKVGQKQQFNPTDILNWYNVAERCAPGAASTPVSPASQVQTSGSNATR